MAMFRTAPPSSLLLGDVVCDDVLLTAQAICQHMTACFKTQIHTYSTHTGVGRGKAVVV